MTISPLYLFVKSMIKYKFEDLKKCQRFYSLIFNYKPRFESYSLYENPPRAPLQLAWGP